MSFLEPLWNFISQPSMVQAIMAIFLVSGLGMFLGKYKLAGMSFGLSFVFFVGILVSHLGIQVDEDILNFIMNFGLVLFVYTLGLQVGPAFMASLKKTGIKLNIYALSVILLGVLCIVFLSYTTKESIPNLMGILNGAVTNMPALGAAQEAVGTVLSHGGGSMSKSILADMAMATAITYPFGVVGVFLVLTLLRKISPAKLRDAEEEKVHTLSSEFIVCNDAIYNLSIKDLAALIPTRIVISQILRGGEYILPKSSTIILEGDHVLVTYEEHHGKRVHQLFGTREKPVKNLEMSDWEHIEENLISRRILITQSEYNGVRLSSLALRNKMDINVTAISRAGIDLLPSPQLRLQMGDRLHVVGKTRDVNKLSAMMGNELKKLDTPYLVSLSIGMLLGCVLGAIPIYIPGISAPIKMGIAGGPLILGIIMGAYGPRLHLTTYITQSANLMVRTLGLVWFMAALGLLSGAHFFDTLKEGNGLLWMGLGAIVTILPTLLVGVVCLFLFRLPFSHIAGVICGSMSNPIALEYANTLTKGDTTAVSYVTVYPLTMCARVVFAQLIVGILMG